MSDAILNRLAAVEQAVQDTQQSMIKGDEHIVEMHQLYPSRTPTGNSGYASFDNLRRLVADLRMLIEDQ